MSLLSPLPEVLTISAGGGSALLPAPIPPITLEEKQTLTKLLAARGATIHPSICPSIPMLTNIYDGLGIVLVTEDTSLALLHFSHELLQTPVLLQSICHPLGSHRPNGVLL